MESKSTIPRSNEFLVMSDVFIYCLDSTGGRFLTRHIEYFIFTIPHEPVPDLPWASVNKTLPRTDFNGSCSFPSVGFHSIKLTPRGSRTPRNFPRMMWDCFLMQLWLLWSWHRRFRGRHVFHLCRWIVIIASRVQTCCCDIARMMQP